MILGVNVDAMHEDAKDDRITLQSVRRFLLKHRVAWPNLLNGRGATNFAQAYGVEHIPANLLVGRDGKVVALEKSGEMLEKPSRTHSGARKKVVPIDLHGRRLHRSTIFSV